MSIRLNESWKFHLKEEFEKPYFKDLTDFVRREYRQKAVYPAPQNIFKALDMCPFERVRVVILGQDPYHGPRQANGLCFSVREGVALPPSLQNIFKEIRSDLGRPSKIQNGDLTPWAEQGVLLLNATLTVQAHRAASHQGKGWEQFTDAIIHKLAKEKEHLVFMLWGRSAQAKGKFIDESRHLVLKSAHPSPLAAHAGFFGNKHFSRANDYSKNHEKPLIDW